MKLLYSAEIYKDLISQACTSQDLETLLFNPVKNVRIEGDQMTFVSDLPDKMNLETLRKIDSINLLLPIRPELAQQDINDKVTALNQVSLNQESYILSNHIEGADLHRISISSSVNRWKYIEQLGEYVASKGESFSEFPDICMTVASELLSNAFYNGPKNAAGESVEGDRTKDVSVGQKPIQMSYGDDGKHIWIRVTDPFGTFNRYALLNHLLKSVGKDQIQVNLGKGGAGIGLFMVFKWASQLLFMFEPGKETTVLVKLLKSKRRKIFENQRTVLEVIQKDSEIIN